MEFQVSARKYRPTTFEEVLGQPHVVQTLTNAITRQRVAHAYVFSGMRGVGKTTVARILAKSLNCDRGPTSQPCGKCPSCIEISRGSSVDVIEIDGASNTGVDDVRELRENVKFSPFHGSYRIYIIDEVHMLSNSAFNALLKTLEEPPSHSIFIFATTEVHKIPATILSRCQHFTFRRISRLEIIEQLRHVVTQTGVTIEERSLSALARASDGSMRDALSLLDQAVSFGGEQLQHEDLEALIGSVPEELVRRMLESILAQEAAQTVSLVGQLVDQGFDIRVYCREILERVRNLMVAAVVPNQAQVQSLLELGDEEVSQTIQQAKKCPELYLQDLFSIFSRTEESLRGSAHPRFLLEAAVVRAALLPKTPAEPDKRPTSGSQQTPLLSEESQGPSQSTKRGVPPGKTPPSPSSAPPPIPPSKETPPSSPTPNARSKTIPSPSSPSRSQKPNKSNPIPTAGQPANPQSPEAVPTAPAQPCILNWEVVADRVIDDHPNIGSFLEKGIVIKQASGQIVLGYSKKDSIARWRTSKPENRALIAKVCQEITGQPITIQVIELPDGQDHPPSIGESRAKKKLADDQDLIENVKTHPLVKQALELFGGKVASAQRISHKEEAS